MLKRYFNLRKGNDGLVLELDFIISSRRIITFFFTFLRVEKNLSLFFFFFDSIIEKFERDNLDEE